MPNSSHQNGLAFIGVYGMFFRNGLFVQVTLRIIGLAQFNLSAEFMNTFPKSTVRSQYFTLTKIKLNSESEIPPMAFEG